MAAITYSPTLRSPVTSSTLRTRAVYRRRRAVALLVAVLVGFVVLFTVVRVAESGAGTRVIATQQVVVEPGDTLWSIAGRIQHDGDLRPLVDRLAAAHGSGPLQPGERITVPG